MKRSKRAKPGWPEKAMRVGELIPLAQLHPAVLGYAARRRKSEPWSVALSGGSDSLALLLLLWAHWPERRENLVVLHFNHRLRGRESTADEAFCVEVCARLNIRLKIGRWSGKNHGASEAESRAARHHFFAAQMKTCRSRLLWLAHQQDDIAETMLMRLARGSGVGGLAAPRPVQLMGDRRTHLRPLLCLKKQVIVEILRQADVGWREDSSNVTAAHFRNRVRSQVLPAWTKAAGRDALAGAARSRELLEEDEIALDQWAGKLLQKGARTLDLKVLAGAPRAVIRRVLHRWLLNVKPDTDLSRHGFELLLGIIELARPTRFSLGRKSFAVIQSGRLTLKRG